MAKECDGDDAEHIASVLNDLASRPIAVTRRDADRTIKNLLDEFTPPLQLLSIDVLPETELAMSRYVRVFFDLLEKLEKAVSTENLVSVKVQKAAIDGMAKLVAFAVVPALDPGVGVPVCARSKAAYSQDQVCCPIQGCAEQLARSATLMLRLSLNPVLGPYTCSKFSCDILAALLQLIHNTENNDNNNNHSGSESMYNDLMEKFIASSCRSDIILDFFLLQRSWRTVQPPQWLVVKCGRYLSQLLLEWPNGLRNTLKAFFDFCGSSDNWAAVEGIASVVTKVPAPFRRNPHNYIRRLLRMCVGLLKSEDTPSSFVNTTVFIVQKLNASHKDIVDEELLSKCRSFRMDMFHGPSSYVHTLPTEDEIKDDLNILARLYLSKPENPKFTTSLEGFAMSVFTALCDLGMSVSYQRDKLQQLVVFWLKSRDVCAASEWLINACIEYVEDAFSTEDFSLLVTGRQVLFVPSTSGGLKMSTKTWERAFRQTDFIDIIVDQIVPELSDAFASEFFCCLYEKAGDFRASCVNSAAPAKVKRRSVWKCMLFLSFLDKLWYRSSPQFTPTFTIAKLLPVLLNSLTFTDREPYKTNHSWIFSTLLIVSVILETSLTSKVSISADLLGRIAKISRELEQKELPPEGRAAVDTFIAITEKHLAAADNVEAGKIRQRTDDARRRATEGSSTSSRTKPNDLNVDQLLSECVTELANLKLSHPAEKGHVLITMTKMIENPKLEFKQPIRFINRIIGYLTESDSYVYLSVINAIIAAAKRSPAKVLSHLAKICVSQDTNVAEVSILKTRVLEAMDKVVASSDTPYYVDLLVGSLLTSFRLGDDLVKASSLSLLYRMVFVAGVNLRGNMQELLYIVEETLKFCRETLTRRAAADLLSIIVLKMNASELRDPQIQECLKKVRRMLVLLVEDADENVQETAAAGLGEIKYLMTEKHLRQAENYVMIFRWDPCGLLCVVLTYLFVGYADYVFTVWLIPPFWSESLWASFHVVLFNTILFGLTFAHMRAMFSDPGIVPMPSVQLDFSELSTKQGADSDSESDPQRQPFLGHDWSVCGRCEAYRPPRAHHCRVCRRCIRKMDHHCPWINNCVGEFNQKYFLQFLFYVGLATVYCLVFMLLTWALPCQTCNQDRLKHVRMLHSVFLTIECVLFSLFVIAVCCDQMQSVLSDETLIEQLQRRGRQRSNISTYARMKEVCGSGSALLWIFPCHNLRSGQEIVRMPTSYHA